MRIPLVNLVKYVAEQEVIPRYRGVKQQRKEDGSLFTEADLAAQTSLSHLLKELFQCPVLGEEMSEEEQRAIWYAKHDYLWCIDPIDGTSNFTHGIDYFAISVALIHHSLPILGVVYNPLTQELFSAEHAKGAWFNGQVIAPTSRVKPLAEAIAAIDFKRLPKTLAHHLLTPPYASQRHFGACALEWCHVALGRFDVYLHGGQKLWDYAAGSLILKEAGGSFTTLTGEYFWHKEDPWMRSVIAANHPFLFKQWNAWLQEKNNTMEPRP